MIKAWFGIRADLGMSAAKLAVQVGHGTDLLHDAASRNPWYAAWRTEGDRRKIILRLRDADELKRVAEACSQAGLLHDLIEDSGYTELDGRTVTGIVIHPIEESLLPGRVRRLRLWAS